MKNEFLDEILEKTINEASQMYVGENADITNAENEEETIQFSDIHNAKMKKLFREIKAKEQKKKIRRVLKSVAAVVLITLMIMTGFVGTVKAWREEVIQFILKFSNNNYMSISFGENESLSGEKENFNNEIENNENSGDSETINIAITSGDNKESVNNEDDDIYEESGENIIREEKIELENNTFVVDDIQFLYVPVGFEYIKNDQNNRARYYSFWDYTTNEKIKLKKETVKDIGKLIDIEKASSQKYDFEDKEVFKIKKDNRIHYIWYIENDLYTVCSDIKDESETLKFIENIKILKKN